VDERRALQCKGTQMSTVRKRAHTRRAADASSRCQEQRASKAGQPEERNNSGCESLSSVSWRGSSCPCLARHPRCFTPQTSALVCERSSSWRLAAAETGDASPHQCRRELSQLHSWMTSASCRMIHFSVPHALCPCTGSLKPPVAGRNEGGGYHWWHEAARVRRAKANDGRRMVELSCEGEVSSCAGGEGCRSQAGAARSGRDWSWQR
jgi:hypothetical protein